MVQNREYRQQATLFELPDRERPGLRSAFVSGKWRLPRFLAQGADSVIASPSS